MVFIKQRDNQLIEVCRFLACVMVVFSHVPFPSPYGTYVRALARFAVPFFLMISGYFLYGENLAVKVQKKLRNTMEIIAVAGTICLIWNSINSYLRYGSASRWIHGFMHKQTLVDFLMFNRAIFFNSVFYYYFMLVYIYLLCLLFVRWNLSLESCRLPMIVILTVCAWYIDHFTMKDWYYVGNALFTGIPMFLIGQHIHAHPDFVRRLKGREILLMLLGLLLTGIEFRVMNTGNYVYFGQILMAVALLCCCLNHSHKTMPRILIFLGSSCSLYIMVIHCEIRDTMALYTDKNTMFFPLIVLALSIALASLIAARAGILSILSIKKNKEADKWTK